MKRYHRRSHQMIWPILIPLLVFILLYGLGGREEAVLTDDFPGISDGETFQ